MENSEVKDIIPYSILKKALSHIFANVDDDDFEIEYSPDEPLLPQIECFANKHSINLEKGWKVEAAKSAKSFLKKKTKDNIEKKYLDFWKDLFGKFVV